jgi:hypothetical protein
MQLPSCIKEKRKEEIRYERQEILEKDKAVHETEQNKTKFNNQKQATYISPIPKILSVTNKKKRQ